MIPMTTNNSALATTSTAYSDGVGFFDGKRNHHITFVSGLTTQAQPRRTSDVARECGTANANLRWLQRFVRRIHVVVSLPMNNQRPDTYTRVRTSDKWRECLGRCEIECPGNVSEGLQ